MIRTLLILFAGGVIVAVVCFAAAGSLGGWDFPRRADQGPQVTREMAWTGNETLRTNAHADIEYTQGPKAQMTVTGPKGIVDDLVLSGDTLKSPEGRRHHWGWDDEPRLTIHMTGPNTHEFVLSGSQMLRISDFDQDSLDIELSGASKAEVVGKARKVDLQISGAGDLDLGELTVDDATVRISGAGKVDLAPKASADVHISGAGTVNLLTKPTSLSTHISGAGSVNQP